MKLQHALQLGLMTFIIILAAIMFYAEHHKSSCVTFMTDDGRPFKVCD
jgi:hypothetical protein